MKKYNYLILIESVLKVIVSSEEMPKYEFMYYKNNPEAELYYNLKLKSWLTASDKFDIADKDNEDKFLLLAGCPESPEGSDFEVKLKQGILIPAENVKIKTGEFIHPNKASEIKNFAYFIPPTLIEERCITCGGKVKIEGGRTTQYYVPIEEGEETQERLLDELIDVVDEWWGHGQNKIKEALKAQFTITLKTK